MGSFNLERLNKFRKGQLKGLDTIVETGTFKGTGTRVMAKNFSHVITIELDEELHKSTSKQIRDEGIENVEFIFGDSATQIKNVVSKLNKPAAFFLDAHWSGDESVDWNASRWKGYQTNTAHTGIGESPSSTEQLPLDREIKAIAEDFNYAGIIYIDDTLKFGKDGRGLKNRSFKGEDWSHFNLYHIKTLLKPRLSGWTNYSDQVIITIRHKPKNRADNFFQQVKFSVFSMAFEFRKILRKIIIKIR
jgi:hypothetical protein